MPQPQRPWTRDTRTGTYRTRVHLADGRVLKRRLASFAELGLGPDGELPPRDTRKGRAVREELNRRREALLPEMLKGEPGRPGAPPRILSVMDDWMETQRPHRPASGMAVYALMREQYAALVGDHPLYETDGRGLRRYPSRRAEAFRAALARRRHRGRPLAVATVDQRLRTLLVFLHWCYRHELLDRPPLVERPAPEQHSPRELSEDQVARLVQIIRARRETAPPHLVRRYEHHELALWSLLALDLRVGELWSRERTDFRLEGEAPAVHLGHKPELDFRVKSRREGWLPLPPAYAAYLAERFAATPGERWLFDDGEGNIAFARDALSQAFGRYLHRPPERGGLGLPGGTVKPTHGFRAAGITWLYEQGAEPRHIQRWARHQRFETTQGYLVRPDAHLQAIAERKGERWSALRRNTLAVRNGND